MNIGFEELPEAVLKRIKSNRCSEEDQITVEMLQLGGKSLKGALEALLNKHTYDGKIPTYGCHSEGIYRFKKGDNIDIENYQPISLLSYLYKLFTKILINRLTKLYFYQPVEGAVSTIDQLYTMRTIIEKYTEYKVQIHLVLIDFQKKLEILLKSSQF